MQCKNKALLELIIYSYIYVYFGLLYYVMIILLFMKRQFNVHLQA